MQLMSNKHCNKHSNDINSYSNCLINVTENIVMGQKYFVWFIELTKYNRMDIIVD